MRVLGICGSLRSGSYNRLLLRAAARELPPGIQFALFGGLGDIPPYNQDAEEPAPLMVCRLREAIAGADALLVATPEYNASIPGVLKNTLDWASRPFPDNCLRGKPVAVIGASTSIFGAVWAQAELRKVLRAIGADPLESALPVAAANDAFDSDGRLRQPAVATALVAIVDGLLRQPSERAA